MTRWQAACATVALFLIAGCERCACDAPPASAPQSMQALNVPRARIGGEGKPTVAMPLLKNTLVRRGDGASLTLVARAEMPAWSNGFSVVLGLNTLEPGPLSPMLQGARCAVRYLQNGMMNEAEMQVVRADGRLIELGKGAYNLSVSLTCEKRVDTTTSGAHHAAALPKRVDIDSALTVNAR